MKKTQKNVTRKLSDWRALYYIFKGARLIFNIESLLTIAVIIVYMFYHCIFISQNYIQDNETVWLLIPIFVLIAIMFSLTKIQCKIEDKYKVAIEIKKRRDMIKLRRLIEVECFMEALQFYPTISDEKLEEMYEPISTISNQ